MSWVRERRRYSVVDVAQRLGLQANAARGWISPCVACGRKTRNASTPGERRGAMGIPNLAKAHCFACGVNCDGIDLVSYSLTGHPLRNTDPAQRAEVRAWFDGHYGASASPSVYIPVTHIAPALPEPVYLPSDELEAFISACIHAADDAEALQMLARRLLDTNELEARKLAAVLPRGARVPIWARFRDRRWSDTGHRLILPLVDAHGITRSVIARLTNSSPNQPKSVAPTGFSRRGLVLANELGREVLTTGTRPATRPDPLRVVITEGEIDFLTAACEEPEDTGPMVLGIASGSWTTEIAARIPNSSRVTIATDNDDAGEKYAAKIVETFEGRAVTLLRWRAAS